MTTSDDAFHIIPQGAIIQSFCVGHQNLVLGFDEAGAYSDHDTAYFGETIGRVANRVQDARLNHLNGRSYELDANQGVHSLHGGEQGWGKKIWDGRRTKTEDGREALVYRYRSGHGDAGYPGAVDAVVTYSGGIDQDDAGRRRTILRIEYEVRMREDQEDGVEETVVNLTNHRHEALSDSASPPWSADVKSSSYFNLGARPTIEGTEVTLSTDLHLPLDEDGIPRLGPQRHPSIRAHQPITLGTLEPRFDECLVLNPVPSTVPLDSRQHPLRTAARFHHSSTGLNLEVRTTEPAFQFYTGDHVDIPAVGDAPPRRSRAGFCVEPGRYVNAVNVEDWRGMVVLRRGQVYGSRTEFIAWEDNGRSSQSAM
ncbi:MAG: hypothetical protein M1817_004271 [Caeruleum heppii]|nr:MAG: hypothetical protein M1817_004271 [Caeruleum heppii]